MNELENDNKSIINMFTIHYKLEEYFKKKIKFKNFNMINSNEINLNCFPEENNLGFIEYKRTLSTYQLKINKLRTQIYWRISEGLIYNLQSMCYFIIGLDDNGNFPQKNINFVELEESKKIIENTINNTCIFMEHMYINFNNNLSDKSDLSNQRIILVIKLWKNNNIDEDYIRMN